MSSSTALNWSSPPRPTATWRPSPATCRQVTPPLAWSPTGSGGTGSHGREYAGGPRRRSGLAAFAGFVVVILALILIAFILPVAFIGTVISRSLLFVLLALLFGRRGILRRFRRWLPRSMRRWPF